MEYVLDPEGPPLKSTTVKSIIMVVFREGKTTEDENKCWNFWHTRQHSVKQRILDADTKNSVGLSGPIEEISHNALAVYWTPYESGAKVSVQFLFGLFEIVLTYLHSFEKGKRLYLHKCAHI